jgi:ElaB/YqjD/DUF883 family membrane-anchored ribosome-binding protein
MEHTNTSGENMAAALKLLEEAASQKKDELRTIIANKYASLKNVIIESDGSLMRALASAKDHALQATAHAKDVGVEKAREIVRDVDKSVHQSPWPYIAGSAVAGLLLGYILGRNRK